MKTEDLYIRCDDFDVMACKESLDEFPEADIVRENSTYGDLDNMLQDFYSSLYKANPAPNKGYSGTEKHSKIIEGFRMSDKAEKMRRASRMDQRVSAAGALSLAKQIMDKFGMNKKGGNEASKALDQIASGKEDLNDATSDTAAMVRVAINDAIKEAEKEVESLKIAFGLLAGDSKEPLEKKNVTMEQASKLVELIKDNDELKAIIDLAGRFRETAKKTSQSKLSHGVDEVYEVGIGDNISRLLPTELVKLRNGRRKEFYLSFIEKRLMEYKLRGAVDDLARGPVVVCMDVSSSMTANRRFEWAKAVALMIHRTCIMERRDYHIILFNGGIVFDKQIIQNGIVDGEALMQLIEFMPHGGTEFTQPLNRSVNIIKEYESDTKAPDVLFITDGYCSMSAEYKRSFKSIKGKEGFALYSVFIGSLSGNDADKAKDDLADISDSYCEVLDKRSNDTSQYQDIFSI